jgi:hypothetical protein
MNGTWNQSITEVEAERIVADINRQGYGILKNYVAEEELAPAQSIAHAAVEAHGGEYACFTGTEGLAGTVLSELPQSAAFQELCRRLYELGTGKTAPKVEFHQVFRCLQGSLGQSNSYIFHYDSFVLTALLPVIIPEEGLTGDLLVIPNTRRIRRFYLSNVLDKAIVDNKLSQIILKEIARRRRFNAIAIKLRPGDMLFFWGYRSIHTNEACDPDKLRATALFHYGNPHGSSRLRTLLSRTTSSIMVCGLLGLVGLAL